jgi:hypothetical protein
MRRSFVLFIACILAMDPAWAQSPPCPLPGQKPMIAAEMYFGRAVRGRAPVSEAEWSKFVARVVAKELPDGFTVYDGVGEWLDPATHNTVRERTKILTVAIDPSEDHARHLQTIIDAYKRQFHQQSVGVTTANVCGAF